MRTTRLFALLLVLLMLGGCASRPINERITQADPQTGYRPYLLMPKRVNNDPQTLFILAFSGGGTRAAALSYGVLEELRRTEIVVDGQRRRLIDEVDIITGVSGGSFTALAYRALRRAAVHRVRAALPEARRPGRARRSARSIRSTGGGTSGAPPAARSSPPTTTTRFCSKARPTRDLLTKQAPVAVANGTDISTGSRLSFYQNDFDLLCSDLNKVRLSRAAATSSAVPVVLSAVTFDNYGGTCGYEFPAWVQDVAKTEGRVRPSARAVQRYREMQEFQNSKERPYIHLVDGGVADNIGMRSVLEALEAIGASATFRGEIGFAGFKRIVVIAANSRSAPRNDWDRQEDPPGLVAQLLQSSGVPIDRYSFETIELMKDKEEIYGWRREIMILRERLAGASEAEAEARVPLPKLTVHTMDVSFAAIANPKERDLFMNMPTTFVLPADDVDRLREIAGRLLRESADYPGAVARPGGPDAAGESCDTVSTSMGTNPAH